MTAFDMARLLDDDPSYRPGYVNNKGHHYWRASGTYLRDGWTISLCPLRGTDTEMSKQCRELTIEMLQWHGLLHSDRPEDVERALHRVTTSFQPTRSGEYFWVCEQQAQKRAKMRGRTYTLPDGWAKQTFIAQRGLCALSGMPMRQDRAKRSPYLPTIDRINNTNGYDPENCRLVCLICNVSRGPYSDDEFYLMCSRASKFRAASNRREVV